MQSRTAAVLASVLLAAVALAAPSAGAPASASSAASGISFVSARSLTPPRGGASRVPPGYLPLHARAFARAKAAANARAGVHAGAGPASATGGPAVSPYPNVSPSFDGTFDTGGTPPDTTGAIGPDRYIETVNTKYAIYSRSGSLVNGGTLSALTGISTGLFGYALSDPQMMWDAQTQRFYYSVLYFDSLFFSDNGIAVGWSKTATPSSASDFCQYAISLGSELPDYPKLGDSSSFLLYGFNEFGNAAQTYDGSAFLTLNKPAAGSSCAPTSSFQVYTSGVLHNLDGSEAATPVPANLVDDATGTGYVVANADLTTTPSANFVSVYSVTVGATDANGLPVPLVSGPKSVSVPAYAMPASAAQQGSSYLLDTLDGRFEAAVAAVDPANGGKLAVWTAHAVFGGAGAEQRWYELDPGAGSVLQSGVVSDPSLAIWNGAVSPDRANTGTSASFGDSMAMSVSTSSASTYPAIQFVWKQGGGAQSALTNLVQANGASVDFSCSGAPSCRWGDYSGASPDPAATGSVGRVWLGNQYNLANGTDSTTSWRTWLFAVTPASGAPPPAALSFGSGAQALTAGQPSAAMQVDVSPPQAADATVSLSSSSPQGQFATSTGGPWSPTLQLTIPSAQPASAAFYYRDTRAGSATLTASATSATSATQTETVSAAGVASITLTPTSATVASGGTQPFNASGADQYGNAVSLAGAAWATTVAGGSVSPTTGASTTFRAGAAAGTGAVTASLGGVTGSAAVTVASTPPPRAPTNLVASPVGRHILLTWTGSGTGVTYNVYRGTSAGGESATPYLRGVGGTSVSDSSVGSGTTYYYRVTAVGAGGESSPSNEAHAKAK